MGEAGDDEERASREVFSRRLVVAGLVQAAGFGLIGGQLYRLQVRDARRYGEMADANRFATRLLAPARGRILDRFGQVLVTGEEAFRAVFIPSLAGDPQAVLDLFSRIVPLDHGMRKRLLARANRQRPNEPIVLADDLSFADVARINLMAPRLPGVETEPAARRRYPTGKVMGHVVGYVGNVEKVAVDDDPILALPWMRTGKTGLERGMEQRLRGRSGRVRLEVNARGQVIGSVERREPVDGADVVATLDAKLQARVLDRLSSERRAAVVVMDVHGGEVLVMASTPTYDPGVIVDGVSEAAWQRLRDAPDDPMVNRTISGQYPPGSTFKMVTALAALEAGTVTPHEHVRCTGRFHLADQTYRCWNRGGHGRVDLVDALRESCDVYFYELAKRTGISRIGEMARRLGFGQTFDCGLDLQKPGIIPGRDWKIGRFGRRWVTGETILAGIGQGYVLVTPLQLAVMSARLATGRAVQPTLVHRGRRGAGAEPSSGGNARPSQSNGTSQRRAQTGLQQSVADLGISTDSLEVVRRGMLACVNDAGGTGWRARFDKGAVFGAGIIKVAGKTGTSQVTRASARRGGHELQWHKRDHALFVAYAPADQPRYAVATVVEHGGGGGAVAAPLTRDILAMVFDRDPLARPVYPDRQAAADTGGNIDRGTSAGTGVARSSSGATMPAPGAKGGAG